MTGPKRLPTFPVPNRCTANRIVRITAEIGTISEATPGAATSTPSTADRTLTAGVMIESP